MFETPLTIVGTIVSEVERRRVERSGATVIGFRVASTARRWDRQENRWVDGDSLYLKVSCWRSLGSNVFHSLFKGDPVIVTGRVYTRSYEYQGATRWSYEMDAFAVGHDLSRGTAVFRRVRGVVGTTDTPEGSGGSRADAGDESVDAGHVGARYRQGDGSRDDGPVPDPDEELTDGEEDSDELDDLDDEFADGRRPGDGDDADGDDADGDDDADGVAVPATRPVTRQPVAV